MIRLMIVLGFFGAGIGLYSGSSLKRTVLRGDVEHASTELDHARSSVASMNEACERSMARIKYLKTNLHIARNAEPVSRPLRRWISSPRGTELGSAAFEGSLRELGFTWESSPDNVLVPKAILGALKVDAIDTSGHLSKVAASVLDLSSDQIVILEKALTQAKSAYVAWVAQAAVRTPLTDPEIVRWQLPIDLDLEAALMGELKQRLDESIGQERRDLFLKLARRPLAESFGNLGGVKATLTVYWAEGSHGRAPAFRYDLATKNAGLGSRFGSMVDDASVKNYPEVYVEDIPALLRPALPGGLAEVLAREGIALPTKK